MNDEVNILRESVKMNNEVNILRESVNRMDERVESCEFNIRTQKVQIKNLLVYIKKYMSTCVIFSIFFNLFNFIAIFIIAILLIHSNKKAQDISENEIPQEISELKTYTIMDPENEVFYVYGEDIDGHVKCIYRYIEKGE